MQWTYLQWPPQQVSQQGEEDDEDNRKGAALQVESILHKFLGAKGEKHADVARTPDLL